MICQADEKQGKEVCGESCLKRRKIIELVEEDGCFIAFGDECLLLVVLIFELFDFLIFD